MVKSALAVLCLINNNKVHTREFVSNFINVPGCRLILFLDDPEHIDFFETPPENLTLVSCTERFWIEQLGRLPVDMPEKQHTNIKRGAEIARELGCSWCVSVDSDELILNLAELIPQLDILGADYDLLRLLPAELVHTDATAFSDRPFPGHLFKYRWSERRINWLLLKLPIRLAIRLMLMRKYTRRLFFGHFNGKTLFKLSADITTYKQHKQFNDEKELSELVLPVRYLILHHDAMNFESWLFKWTRRISGSTRATAISDQRKRQTTTIANTLRGGVDAGASKSLFRKWFVFDQREIEAMKNAEYLLDINDSA